MTKYASGRKNQIKRKVNKFTITEISAVTKPMQEGATALLLKTASLEKDKSLSVLLTTPDETGHSHLLDLDHEYRNNETSYASAVADESSHSHPYIISADGGISIGEINGHTHEVDPDSANSALFSIAMRENIKRDLELDGNSVFKMHKNLDFLTNAADSGLEGSTMPGTKEQTVNEKTVADLNKQIETLTTSVNTTNTELEVAKAYGCLTDVEKVHYETLGKADKAKFLSKSAEDRTTELEAIKKADPIVYTSPIDGQVFYKSDDKRLVDMAKREATRETEMTELREKAENEAFQKVASTDLEFMAGTLETRVALLKAVDTIADKTVKEEVLKSLKAQNAKRSGLFKTSGTTTESDPIDVENADAKLETLAKAHVSANPNVKYLEAYSIVCKANPELYKSACGS